MPDDPTDLLRAALPHLRRYRTVLLESRSGAAAPEEQEALALGKLVRAVEAALAPATTEP